MEKFYDVSEVKKLFTYSIPNSVTYENVGYWHNYIIYQTLERLQTFGSKNPSIREWLDFITAEANDLVDKNQISSESLQVVEELIAILKVEDDNFDVDFITLSLKQLHLKTQGDLRFANSPIVLITCVAFHSASLHSKLIEHNTKEIISGKRWLIGVAADIGGALGGIGTGSLLGPWGIVGGGLLGAGAGTIAAL